VWVVGARGEWYRWTNDRRDRTDHGLVATAGSLTLDHAPAERVLLRFEGRLFGTDERVWPARDGLERRDAFLMTSLAVTF
jgi:hypothetical protein